MIRQHYYKEEDLKHYERFGIIKTEELNTRWGKRKYVTFGKGLVLHYDEGRSLGGDPVWGMKIWDPVNNKPDCIGFGYVDIERDPNEFAEVDATPEVDGKYKNYLAEKEKKREEVYRLWEEKQAKERAEQEAKTPRKGKYVKVVKGRKVPIGTVGEVFWYGQNKYGWGVGIELADEQRVFTSDRNVEVIKPEEVPAE